MTTVDTFVTHFLGLPVVTESFPGVQAVATPTVAEELRKVAP